MKRFLPLVVIALGTAAAAHEGVKNPDILARMESMKEMSGFAKIIGNMAKGEVAFDAAAANAPLASIAEHAEKAPELFREPLMEDASEALPSIWENFPDFEAKSAALVQAARVQVTTEADLGPVLMNIGSACKSCHTAYRE